MFRKLLDEAQAGDNIGALLKCQELTSKESSFSTVGTIPTQQKNS